MTNISDFHHEMCVIVFTTRLHTNAHFLNSSIRFFGLITLVLLEPRRRRYTNNKDIYYNYLLYVLNVIFGVL